MSTFQPLLQPVPASGSKLAALFSSDESANVSLQFKAPRAPRPAAILSAPAHDPATSRPAEATNANPGLAFASTCHLFRFYEGGYQPVLPPGGTGEDGSVGIVVMGTGQDDKMRILCYDKAKAQAMTVDITGSVEIIPQPGRYVSLKDDAGAVWSIRFRSDEDLFKATCAMALARSTHWSASTDSYPLVKQDAVAGNVGARGAASGDRVSIRYQAWLQSAQGRGILGEALQDEFLPAEFTLGHNAVIRGWEEGVSGMSVGCVRWLVVPPQLAYGDAGRPEASIPAHAVLVMRVHLVDLTEGQAAADRPLPVMGGVTIASAIKMLRPPTPEAGDEEWASGTPFLFLRVGLRYSLLLAFLVSKYKY